MLRTDLVPPAGTIVENKPSKSTREPQDCPWGCNSPVPQAGESEHMALIPAIALVLLPKCPLCLAAWFGILGSLGVNSWLKAVWGTPLAAGLLSFAVGALALRARRSRDTRPLLVGLLGAAALLGGKCFVDAPMLLYSGLGLLLGASFWSSWLKSSQARRFSVTITGA